MMLPAQQIQGVGTVATGLAPRGAVMPNVTTSESRPLMRFIGNDEMFKKEEEERKAAQDAQNQPVILNLAAHLRKCWQQAYEAKIPIRRQMEKSLRQRKGEYEPSDLAKIQMQGGTEIFINITNVKCRATEAWLYDILLPPGERPWGVNPTPMPELEPGIEQEVQLKGLQQIEQLLMMKAAAGIPLEVTAEQIKEQLKQLSDEVLKEIKEIAGQESEKLEDEIDDDLVEGGWYQAIRDCIPDISTFPAGILEGPIVKKKKQLAWSQYPDGTPYVTVEEKPIRTYGRVSPFDIYPSPGAKSFQDGFLCHHIRFERKDLVALQGVEGFDEQAIRLVLDQYGRGGLRDWMLNDTTRYELENRPPEYSRNAMETIDCVKFMGPVQGVLLLQWGMSPEEITEPLKDYEVTAYLIGQYVIGAKLNHHPLGRRNYFSASFERSNSSPWGKGVPELMADIQKICNGCARALVNNMAMASGPQVSLLANRVADGETITSIIPWKIWRMISKGEGTKEQFPIQFYQPQVIVEPLLKIYEYFFKQASEVTGIPAYVYGSDNIGGAGRTASGLSMLMNAASKGLKAVASHIDQGIIKPSIEETWLHIMLYEPERAKGDIKIFARASEYLIMMEQLQIRRMEFLNLTNNPIDVQITGMEGRAEVLRETARALKMPVDRVIPPREDMEARLENAKIQLMVTNIANALGVDPAALMQIAMAPMQNSGGMAPKPAGLAVSGDRAAGQDFRMAA